MGIFMVFCAILVDTVVNTFIIPIISAPESENHRQTRIAAEVAADAKFAADKKEKVARNALTAQLCKAKPLCEDYANERQKCATAGNYRTCMEIKLGPDEFLDAKRMCTDNGHVNYDPVPTFLDCLNSR
jgi:hypothetical protein